ncbi:MAG: MFS transporter [Parcubacteria group bacterium]|jgi:DHA1 family tetracycline resistance protein-like MFS transporter
MENFSKIKIVIVFTVLINVIGAGIVIPVLPYYVESFGATPFQVTLLFAVFALCSFFSSPFLGALSDKIGRRPVLIASIISTFFGWLVFALAGNIIFLFIGRIIDGLAAGNISIAQSSLVDISRNSKERTQNLGLIGAAFGIGLVIGPLIGGLLSSFSPAVPFWFATALAFIDVIVAFIFLNETIPEKKHKARIEWNPFSPLRRAAANKRLIPNFIAWFFFTMAFASTQAIFALYIDRVFGLGALAAGIFFAGTGLIVAFNQIVALKHFWLKYFSEPGIEFWMILVTGAGFLIMGIKFLFIFSIGMLIIAFGQSILRVVMTSQIVGNTRQDSRGEIIGITSSIQWLGMTIAPIIAGAIFTSQNNFPFILSGVYMLIAFVIILGSRRRMAKVEYIPETPMTSV